MEYIPKTVEATSTFPVASYELTDYVQLHAGWNDEVDWNEPYLGRIFHLQALGHNGVDYTLTTQAQVAKPGTWTFALGIYDQAGNLHSGIPGTDTLFISLTPKQPSGPASLEYDGEYLTVEF